MHASRQHRRLKPASLRATPRHEAARVHAVEATHGPASPLPAAVQQEAAERYGFSHVRIHSDDAAAAAAGSLNAAAFTLGNDIVFGSGRYAPASPQGGLLLQHDLRHVKQQRSARRVEQPEFDSPHSAYEQAAHRLLDPRVGSLSEQRIQRAPKDAQFSISGGALDTVGKSVIGDPARSFLRSVFEGFVGGLAADVKAGRADKAKEHLSKLLRPWNALKFYGGYLVGLLIGLVSPITDLVKGIIGLLKLSISALDWLAKCSPSGIAASPERQAKIVRLVQKFGELSVVFNDALMDFAKDPAGTVKKSSGFLDSLMQLALGKARELGGKAAHAIFDFHDRDFYEMGKGVGEVIGALIALVLLAVFSDAIGNLISEGASLLGKAAEFVAGKAVQVFEWIKGFVSEIGTILRNAVKGALKLFEGLANKAMELFRDLAALFSPSETFAAGSETALAGGGRGVAGPLPNAMESRMFTPDNPIGRTVEELRTPKVHPSNVGGSQTKGAATAAKKEVMGPMSTAEAVEDLERTRGGARPAETAVVGTEIGLMEVEEWSTELAARGYLSSQPLRRGAYRR
jgi:hypothetical protein